jgi:hypothetical protein
MYFTIFLGTFDFFRSLFRPLNEPRNSPGASAPDDIVFMNGFDNADAAA